MRVSKRVQALPMSLSNADLFAIVEANNDTVKDAVRVPPDHEHLFPVEVRGVSEASKTNAVTNPLQRHVTHDAAEQSTGVQKKLIRDIFDGGSVILQLSHNCSPLFRRQSVVQSQLKDSRLEGRFLEITRGGGVPKATVMQGAHVEIRLVGVEGGTVEEHPKRHSPLKPFRDCFPLTPGVNLDDRHSWVIVGADYDHWTLLAVDPRKPHHFRLQAGDGSIPVVVRADLRVIPPVTWSFVSTVVCLR